MKAEKKVRTYTRRTKSGKTITVKEHTAKYEAADKKDAAKKEGAGKELEERKKKSEWGKMSAKQIKDAKDIMEQTGVSQKEAIKSVMSYKPQKGEIGYKESGRRSPHARGRKTTTQKATSKDSKVVTATSVDAQLKKLGLRMYRTSTGGIEIYKTGDRKSLKNLVAGVHYNGRHIGFGGNNEKVNEAKYRAALTKIFSGGVTEKSSKKPITKKTTIHKEVSSGDGGTSTKSKRSLSKKSTPSKIDVGKSVMNLPTKGIPTYPVRGRKTKK